MSVELLAPAGNLEKLKIAFQYGADAVYIAGQQFGLRYAANNFSIAQIREAVDFARAGGKKLYMAVNAFLTDNELKLLPNFIKITNDCPPDAFICSDLGVASTIREFSSVPIHVSTQTSVLNSWHARVWKKLGAKRIIVGRELSIKEAAAIKEKTGLEVEMFVHGAMCAAYSGHCAISNYMTGRDSNRGGCAQNCRFEYQLFSKNAQKARGHLLSSKDLNGIRLLKHFMAAGVDSLKIEGRMKSGLYVASTVRAYSRAIKQIKKKEKSSPDYWIQELEKLPNRQYTEGSLIEPASRESICLRPKQTDNQYKMAGAVISVDRYNKYFFLLAKNKLRIGDTIEIMPFKGKALEIKIENIYGATGEKMTVAQPHNVFRLPWRPGIEVGNVAGIPRHA